MGGPLARRHRPQATGRWRRADHPGTRPRVIRAFGPGRVNLIGEHTDYNGGLALPFAIDRGVTVEAEPLDGGRDPRRGARPRRDRRVRRPPRPAAPRAGARSCAARWRSCAPRASPSRGARLAFAGDVPQGSGLSSSAALEAALCLALLAVAGAEEPDRTELAKLCSRVENDWVGAETGLLDQLASLHGRAGAALRIDFATLELRAVPLELGDWRLVTLDSGARAQPRGGRLQRAPRGVPRGLRGARRRAPLRRRPGGGRSGCPSRCAGARATCCPRTRASTRWSRRSRPATCARPGRLLDASHASLRDDYEASVAEVEATVAALKRAGAAGARMVGGGFGGSVLALLPPGADPRRAQSRSRRARRRVVFEPPSAAASGPTGAGAPVTVRSPSAARRLLELVAERPRERPRRGRSRRRPASRRRPTG